MRAFLKCNQYRITDIPENLSVTAEDFPRHRQVIAVTIADFFLSRSSGHYISRYVFKEREGRENYPDGIIWYFLEIPKFRKKLEAIGSIQDKWVYFFRHARELDEIPDQFRSPPFDRVFERANFANMSRQEELYYDKACMVVGDARGSVELAMEEGKKIGMEKIAGNMLQSGMDAAQVCQ